MDTSSYTVNPAFYPWPSLNPHRTTLLSFSPGTIAAGGAVTPVSLIIQTSTTTARNERPGPSDPVALGLLLLPLLGLKSVRERLRQMPRLPAILLALGLSVGAALTISGSGSSSPPPPQSYPLIVTATDAVTTAQSMTSLTLTVQ